MLAWMNAEAVARTLASGRVTWLVAVARGVLGQGEAPARLIELRLDCDRDCLLVLVDQTGPACHTDRRSCFYTAVRDRDEVESCGRRSDGTGGIPAEYFGQDERAGQPRSTIRRISSGVAPSARNLRIARASSRLASRLPSPSRIRR